MIRHRQINGGKRVRKEVDILKKLILILSFILVLGLAACGNETNNDVNNTEKVTDEVEVPETENNNLDELNADGKNQYEGEELAEGVEKEDLTLQVLKVDEEDGITIENNEFYQAIQAEIESDSKMGDHDDFSLLPLDVVYYEDNSISLMLLAINRLKDPIQNIAFDFTLGNQEGEYIFENFEVDLTEDYMGTLQKNGAIPFFLDITEEDEELFYTLSDENVHMEMDNFKIDFVE